MVLMQWDGYWDKDKVKFLDYEYSAGKLVIRALMLTQTSTCPSCGLESSKVHSIYERSISDLACFGSLCVVKLECRRFFCMNTLCKQKLYCERLGSMVKAYARKSTRLMSSLQAIGFKIAAHAAAQLCKYLGIATSASSVNRYLRSYELESFETPRVLGIDDWAMSKGRRYGTLLVDLEKRKPIELIEGRDAEALSSCLKHYPNVEIISRDRSGEYALGVSQAAPEAIEVADRWHLLKNLREMIERYFQSKSKLIEQAFK